MTAVVMLVFKDTILSLVTSIQLASNDIIREGDWVEIPQFNADGDVIDISLHTVRIQNFDKTIVTIPTHKLIDGSFKNWRGMATHGARRVMRSINLDMSRIRFLDERDLAKFKTFALLETYINQKLSEIPAYPSDTNQQLGCNSRRLTNVGTYRAYILAYLKNHDRVAKTSTLLVRQLQPTAEGLPMQIYIFLNTTAWAEYEHIQADIFDHLLAITAAFDLGLFQNPTGANFQQFLAR